MRTGIFFLIALTMIGSVFAQDYEYRPFVEDGKTWWYSQYERVDSAPWEMVEVCYGVSLRGDSVIDGASWKPLIAVKPDGTPFENGLLGFFREEGKQIISRARGNYTPNVIERLIEEAACSGVRNEVVCDFGLKVGDITPNGPVIAVDTIGYEEYRRVRQRIYDNFGDEVHTFYEGVGAFTHKLIATREMMWYSFSPRPTCADILPAPQLQYVTDSDFNILFTGHGRIKPWEKGLVEEVVAEPCGEAVYFNLQGQPCAAPLAPGIYIRCQGARAEKVAIR